jgi:transcriptional regulator with XRE-family HTH domain
MENRKRRELISEQIREAIEASGVSRYRIAADTGLSESMLSLFMAGKRMLSLQSVDLLATYLDLELVQRRRK